MQTTQMALSWWRKKNLPIVHPYSEMPINNKKAINFWSHHSEEPTLSDRAGLKGLPQCVVPGVWHEGKWGTVGRQGSSVVSKGWVGGVSDYSGEHTAGLFLLKKRGTTEGWLASQYSPDFGYSEDRRVGTRRQREKKWECVSNHADEARRWPD